MKFKIKGSCEGMTQENITFIACLKIISLLTLFSAKFFRICSTSQIGRISLMTRSKIGLLSLVQSLEKEHRFAKSKRV